VDEVLATATSAVREAKNGGEFLGQVARATGINARVISGAEEARLIHLAAVSGVDVGAGRAVVIDIGGGSVEITLGNAASIQMSKSFKLGAIRLTERFVKSDPLSRRDEDKLVAHIREAVDRHCGAIATAGFDRVIGTSGTILSLGTVAATESRGVQPEEIRNLRVTAKQIRSVRKQIVAMKLEERLAVPGLDPRRADIVVAGSVVLDTILSRLGASEITLCDLALREGIIIDYIRSHRGQIAQADQVPDIRRRSTLALAERCNYYADHSQHVGRLALAIFDQTRGVHGLTERAREWLEFAATMHDIGALISYPRHHRHSYYLIKNGDLRGFDPEEIEILALIARYHRRGAPKKSQEEYAQLPGEHRHAVRVLASILRIAESLDRSHAQVISGIEVHDQGAEIRLVLHASEDAELEMWAAARHLAPFERLMRKPVRLELAPVQGSARQTSRARPGTGASGGTRARTRAPSTAR
jgi:exopolyphosphatase/guanosine-5'-triphosphate,3'-diphosphate pyrophosphatase